jgi:protocadherin Fat 1/2/3
MDDDERGTPNARVTYSISGDPDNIFMIQQRTGIVTSLHNLDRETTPHYHLVVKASDGGGLYCTSDVYITVTDDNDNAPLFTQTVYTAQVSEDAEVNSLLVRVSANDADAGTNV